MPRPGQPGAMEFNGTNVSEFLENWNIECDDYGLNDSQKCIRLPNYCTPVIKDIVKLLGGYETRDWAALQKELKDLYWQNDTPKNSTTALCKLIKDAPTMDLNIYVLKYSAITDALVSKGALSSLDRVGRLLDGLPEELRKRVLKFCTKKSWRLSAQDMGTVDPNFDELKEFVLTEAQVAQKQSVYDKEREIRNGDIPANEIKLPESASPAMSAAMPVTPVVSSTPDPISELSKQFAQLSLFIQAQMKGSNVVASVPTSNSAATRNFGERRSRCHYCDSTDHGKPDCSSLSDDIRKGQVRINERGRIVNAVSGEELPLMFGKGGMKRIIELSQPRVPPPAPPTTPTPTPPLVNVSNITFDDEPFGKLGEGSVRVTTLDFDNGIRTDEIIDADVNEKRKRNDLEKSRRVRSRIDGGYPPVTVTDVPEEDMPDAQEQRHRYGTRYQTNPTPLPSQPLPVARALSPMDADVTPDSSPGPMPAAATSQNPKFRLASELNQSISTSDIGEKIMNTSVQLSIREILAVSGDVSNYLHDQTRKRRVPIESAASTTSAKQSGISADVNHIDTRTFYACPSGRAKVNLDNQLQVTALLDDGSELNILPRRIYERLDLPIDTEIDWRINGYDTKAREELESLDKNGHLLGVCHDVLVDIGGVGVKQHIFVVEHANADLILGRPWGRSTRAEFKNEDDGTYVVRIKSQDGRRLVKFIAAPAEHERNREYARHAVDGVTESLKA
jgi:hypothetical protein